jgi:hypothetical protein
MPLLRYFVYVGGALLALLFAVSPFMPAVPAVEASKSTVDRSIIRIHSDRKWPERVVFDTSRPTPPPPNLAVPVVAEAVPPQKIAAAPPLKGQVREAYAQLRPNPNEFRNPEPKRKRKPLARRDARPPTFLVAQQPRFGFFGNNIW